MIQRCGLVVFVLSACSSDAGVSPDASLDAANTVLVSGTFYDPPSGAVPSPSSPRLAGVEVCVVGGAPEQCVTSSSNGTYTMSVPRDVPDLRLTFVKAGFGRFHYVTYTEDTDRALPFWLPTETEVAAVYASCGATYAETAASLLVQAYSYTPPNNYDFLQGAVISATAGTGPCYFSGDFTHDSRALTTQASGYGVTMLADVPGDSVDVTIEVAGASCKSRNDVLESSAANTIRAPIHPGFITMFDASCE